MSFSISADFVAAHNEKHMAAHREDYAHLGKQLARRGLDIEKLTQRAMDYTVAVPTWGVGTGGTRFARFPGPGEPRHIHDKLEDCGVIHQLTRSTGMVSPHIPWDKVTDYNALRQEAAQFELGFDAVNSNTFQDQKDQKHSYKFGSLSHANKVTRQQAVEHNLECIEIGKALGSTALTVWIADGTNFPGQQGLGKQFENYLEACEQSMQACPRTGSCSSNTKCMSRLSTQP
jgi:L-rhamnose isomerase / sugar isomerase